MKIKFQFLKFWFLAALFVGLFSCNSGNNTKKPDNAADSVDAALQNQGEETFYLIPSPEDMFAFTQDSKLKYNAVLLNPTANAAKYNDTKMRELNFGIYSADLAYSAAFGKYQESVKYLQVVRKLSDDIGMSVVFNEALAKRIENIIDNPDSLLKVTSDAYYDIVKYLEKTGRESTLALISVGGWVESIYVVSNLVEKYSQRDVTIQRLADQKIIFSNLLQYLQQKSKDPNVKSVLEDLEELKKFYDSLEVIKVEKKVQSKNKTTIVVGGPTRIKMTDEQLKELRKVVTKLRGKLTGNAN